MKMSCCDEAAFVDYVGRCSIHFLGVTECEQRWGILGGLAIEDGEHPDRHENSSCQNSEQSEQNE